MEKVKKILDQPLPDEAVSQHPTKKFLSTIKGIYVVERLNEAFGIGGWYVQNEVVETREYGEKVMVVVKSSFHAMVEDKHIQVLDIFGGNDNPDLGDAYKGACTDALTKIGSYLGIGMDVFKGLHGETASKPASKSAYKAQNAPVTNKKGSSDQFTDCEACGAKKRNRYKLCYPCKMNEGKPATEKDAMEAPMPDDKDLPF